MQHKILWRCTNGFLFLTIFILGLTQVQYAQANGAGYEDPETSTKYHTERPETSTKHHSTKPHTERPETSTKHHTTTKRPYNKKKNNYDKYGQDMVGYDNDDRDEYRNRYDDRDDDGYYYPNGIDPRPHGQDMADNKPIYDDSYPMLESLDIWIPIADDWEQKGKKKYRGRGDYGSDKYGKKPSYKDKYSKGKDNNYDDDKDDYEKKGNYQKKRSYEKVKFPVRHYKDVNRFPIRKFPPLFSTFPWLPIFYDKITYQTFIFSPTGGIYVLPPLINFYGKRFAVAQLIKWGYASLVSTGAPPPPGVNVAPLVQPTPAAGGSEPAPPQIPYNPENGRFNGGVTTNAGAFRPKAAEIAAAESLNGEIAENNV